MKNKDKKSAQFVSAREKLGITQAEMATRLGMSLRTYQNYEMGVYDDTDSIRSEKQLEKLKSVAMEPAARYERTLSNTHKQVPVYDIQAQASNTTAFDDDLSELPKSYVTVPGFEDCTFAVYVWNHSMYPTFENGCMVIVKEIKRVEAVQYGSVYLVITDEQRVVKRLYEDEDVNFVLMASDNPETRKDGKTKYPTYRLEKKHIKKLFLVKGTIKRTEI